MLQPYNHDDLASDDVRVGSPGAEEARAFFAALGASTAGAQRSIGTLLRIAVRRNEYIEVLAGHLERQWQDVSNPPRLHLLGAPRNQHEPEPDAWAGREPHG